MRQLFSGFSLVLLVALTMLLTDVNAANAVNKETLPIFENSQLRLKLFPRSTEQMAGFFEARGFPASMIQRLSEYCFFTVTIKNKMNSKLWLDLGEWHFTSQQQDVLRIPRSKWPPIWQALNTPLAAQATFRWTLLPETLQFYADESEGGNIVLHKTDLPFTLHARFTFGDNRESLLATVNNVRCADAVEMP
jgi:hypothetical protein